ncbi:MAG: hypothetical protein HOP28_10185 [Gemmatimonadales bacterium]|nr:hypothetical protein [Gemmatimonadales bacterium]
MRLADLAPTPRIAVAVLSPMGGGMIVWPAAVKDHCAESAFAMGSAPTAAQFSLTQWATLQLAP